MLMQVLPLRILLLLTALISAPFSQAEIYKWVDERGNVHFSDEKPEIAPVVETIRPNTDKMGVQLTQPASAEQWKQGALQPPASAATSSPSTPATASGQRNPTGADYQQQDWCEGVVANCFTEQQDYVCKLRYGRECQDIYHWKVCLHQHCTDNRLADKCDSPFYFLDKRPNMLGRRDLGRPLPMKEWVSAQDWACLATHGFFCDEVAFEANCQEHYRQSCAELKNWVSTAQERCISARDGDCKDIDSLIRYRPAPVEEVKKAGTMNASGRVITQDQLLQSLGVHKNDPADYTKLQSTLQAITGLNIDKHRRRFDCERRWP